MNLPKISFVVTTLVTVVGASFLAGIYSALHENAAYALVGRVYSAIKESLQAVSDTSVLTPSHFLQPARGPGSGVTVNSRSGDGSLILLSGFFDGGNELRLIRRDGSIVNRWPVRFSKLFPNPEYMTYPKAPATDWNIDLHGALILHDGSVLFNFDYGGLAKLDRCGKLVWTLNHMTHHSIEISEEGGFWVPGRRTVTSGKPPYPPFELPNYEDLLLHVSDDGKILTEISVPGLLYKNNLAALLTATGEHFRRGMAWDHELVHLNKIDELSGRLAAKFPMFQRGDLLLSLREHNLVFVIDPRSERIKWWQTGPWVRQHDPEFNANGMIAVFNNNAYESALVGDQSPPGLPRTSDILAIDPSSRAVQVEYGGKPGQEMLSVIRGKQHGTVDGGFFVTEFEAGRVFETDADGHIVWEYINRYDADRIAELTEGRIYPAAYFDVAGWSCGSNGGT